MATSEKKFTRIPPRSTGDRIQVNGFLAIPYGSLVSPDSIKIGDMLSTSVSAWSGEVIDIDRDTVSTGVLYVSPSVDNDSDRNTPDQGENITVGGSSVASVSATPYDIYTNTTSIVSHDNMFNGQIIDEVGAGYVRFPDGPMEIDTHGRARVSSGRQLGSYAPNYDGLPFEFDTKVVVSGTAQFDTVSSQIILSNPTVSGCLTALSSNVWHKHVSGQSSLIEIFTALGGGQKTNVERRWGYFDDNDGLFFYNDGTQTGICIRSSTTGSVVERKIPQNQWNRDHLDGDGDQDNPSKFQLNLENLNGYVIGYEYPTGVARFSVVGSGKRITVHVEDFAGTDPNSMMRTPSLPVRWEQENKSTSGSTSEMKTGHARVWTEGDLDVDQNPYGYTLPGPITISGTNPINIFSIRAKETFQGRDNRVMCFPLQMYVYCDKPIVLGSFFAPVPSVPTPYDAISNYNIDALAAFEIDNTNYEYDNDGVEVFYQTIAGPGAVVDFDRYVVYQGGNHIVKSAYGTQYALHYHARPLFPTDEVTIHYSYFWTEILD